MSINMADVKQIINNANNKEVVKIEDGLGNVLWQKQSAKVLQSITLSGQTTSLNRGATFSFGGTVTANYSDGSTADVTADTTFSGYNMSTAGTYTVTASYTEGGTTVTATYGLTVNKAYSTIWSGSAWAKRTTSGSNNVFSRSTTSSFYTLPTTYTKFRFTFTISWGSVDKSHRAYVANWTTVDSLTSPYVIDNPRTSAYLTIPLLEIEYNNSGATSYHWKLGIGINKNKALNLIASGDTTRSGESGTTQFTLTKIEAYY